MLAENGVRQLLKDKFIVAMDPHYPHNATSFGVWTWIFAPDGAEVEKYWYGTGNNIISLSPATGEKRRIEIHERQTRDMRRVLEESVRRWGWMREGKRDEILREVLDDAKQGRKVGDPPLGRAGLWWAWRTPLAAKLETTVALGDEGRLWTKGLQAACAAAEIPVRLDVTAKPPRGRAMRYPESMRTARVRTWLNRVSRSGLHWYVDGETVVITDDAQKALAHYAKKLPGE